MTARERAERAVRIWKRTGVMEPYADLINGIEYEINMAIEAAQKENLSCSAVVHVDNEEVVKERDELRERLTCLENKYTALSRIRERSEGKLCAIRDIVTSS